MVLSEDQLSDLHKMVLAYLKESKFTKTFELLQEKVKLKPESKRNLLASKWRSIMKLNKQIMDLEAKHKLLLEDQAALGKSSGKVDTAHRLPRAPAKFSLKSHSDVITCCKVHPKFGLAASCAEDASIKVWNIEGGEEEKALSGHQDAVQALAFHPKGSQIASVSADMSIKIWDTEEYKCIKTISSAHEHNISGVSYSKDGKLLFTCSRDKTIKVWDTAMGICRETLTGHGDWVRQVVVSPEGKRLASCSVDKTIKIWTRGAEAHECTATLEEHDHIIETIAFSHLQADQCIIEHLLSASEKKRTKEAEQKRKEEEGKDYEEPEGRFLLSGSRDRLIKLWDLETGKTLLTLEGHKNWVRGVLFHPGGKFVVSCSDDKSIRVWNLEKKGEIERTIDNAHELFVTCIDMPAKLPLLVSGGVDHSIKVWELK